LLFDNLEGRLSERVGGERAGTETFLEGEEQTRSTASQGPGQTHSTMSLLCDAASASRHRLASTLSGRKIHYDRTRTGPRSTPGRVLVGGHARDREPMSNSSAHISIKNIVRQSRITAVILRIDVSYDVSATGKGD
jgi:hypothetical protein